MSIKKKKYTVTFVCRTTVEVVAMDEDDAEQQADDLLGSGSVIFGPECIAEIDDIECDDDTDDEED